MTPQQKAAYDRRFEEQVRLGIEDIEAGRIVSHEQLKADIEELLRTLEAEDERERRHKAA